ncbi:Erythronolide synthase, modules 1 and 2 [Micromonospora sp. MW-13]|nr:Erythronolide synthase, modules 1 and 2 [Micromonospora sp. MW-13]
MDTFLEVGPDAVLTAMVAEVAGDGEVRRVAVLRRDRSEVESLLAAVGQLHAAGVSVDWSAYLAQAGVRPRVVDLPTYAFDRQRYWLADPEPATAPAAAGGPSDERFWAAVESGDLGVLGDELAVAAGESSAALLPKLARWRRDAQRRSAVDSWRYRVVWRTATLPAAGALTGTWLVLASPGQEDHPAVAALAARGARAVPVVLDSVDRDAVARRLREAAGPDGRVDGVLSLLSLAATAEPGVTPAAAEPGVTPAAAEPGVTPAAAAVSAALTVVQALTVAGVGGRVWWLTSGAVAVGGSEAVENVDGAAVWGLGRVVGLEEPGLWGGLVDVPGVAEGWVWDRLCGVLVGGAEDQVAVRSSGVFVRRLVRADVGSGAGTGVRLSGTVLVTGGTGGLGLRVAEWAAEVGAEHVVLVSRRGEDGLGTDGAGVVERLRGSSVRVSVVACDVADRAAMAALLTGLAGRGDRVRAVVHAAGVAQMSPLGEVGKEELGEVLRAKVGGAVVLDELLAGAELDAFVVFSSIAGVWGSAGQAGYAAGNAFVEGLVASRRARGLVGTSVAWGPWAEVGMAVGDVGEQLSRRGLVAMAPESAVVGLARALEVGDVSVVVADVRWDRFASSFTALRPSPLLTEIPEAQPTPEDQPPGDAGGAPSALRERLAVASAAERERILLDLVRGTAATVLGHATPAAIRPGRGFLELGFDSLTAVELRNRLTAETGLGLPATLIFDHPTPGALAEHLRAGLVPEQPALPIAAEVERLDQLLGEAADQVDEAVIGRLENMLAKWRTRRPGGTAVPAPAETAGELDTASREELFDIIQREFGKS